MANKWAIANGNWSDGSTWNDGVVPTSDDDVWLNGNTLIADVNIHCKSVTNDISPDTGVGGGVVNFTGSKDIVCDVYAVGSVVFNSQSSTVTINYMGNSKGVNGWCFNLANVTTLNATGNFKENSFYAKSNWLYPILVGEVDASNGPVIRLNLTYTSVITGTLILKDNNEISINNNSGLDIVGTLKLIGSANFRATSSSKSLKLNGILDISESTYGYFPLITDGGAINIVNKRKTALKMSVPKYRPERKPKRHKIL